MTGGEGLGRSASGRRVPLVGVSSVSICGACWYLPPASRMSRRHRSMIIMTIGGAIAVITCTIIYKI